MRYPNGEQNSDWRGEGLQLTYAVPESWVDDFEDSREARNLARLAGDNELYYQLAFGGFSGPLWERFSDLLARYGYQVILAWLSTGIIYAKCKQHRIKGVNPPALPLRPAEREELASLTVGVAIGAFRDQVLAPGKWDPRRGASLKTYFIGQCLFRFRDELRQFVQERTRPYSQPKGDKPDKALDADPAAMVELREELEKATRLVKDQRTLVVLEYLGKDWPQDEIAEVLGVSVGTVESILYRHRRRMKKLQQEGD